ncbi:MAG: glutamine amidotransferase [Clostridia bacterium]|jgi:hypothetical protein
MKKIIRICHLYPDILNLYGDLGNIITLQKRLLSRGIDCSIDNISVKDNLNIEDYDIFFIGGGQDFEQEILLEDLLVNKKPLIKAAVEENKTFLAICGGYQLLGNYYKTWDGITLEFVGALNVNTIGDKKRMIGDYIYTCEDEKGSFDVVSFENHSGKTYLSKEIKPLGTVIIGNGNNGKDKTEGVRYKNVFASYGHGPLLPKNPRLADLILKTCLQQKYGDYELMDIDDSLELKANRVITERLKSHIRK